MLEDIANKGYCVVKNLIPIDVIEKIRQDYNLTSESDFVKNKNYPIALAGDKINIQDSIDNIVDPLVKSIADVTLGMVYYSTDKGINFPWHQDYESYFIAYDHLNNLNIYIPIYKPDPGLSNVCVLDFSKLEKYAPEFNFLKGYGATRFECKDDTTICTDENNGRTYVIPVNFDKIMDQPNLAIGDALIMRGDCIHRTQDTLTNRTAISIRRVHTKTIVSKSQHLNLNGIKQLFRKNNPLISDTLDQLFAIKDTWTIGEALSHLKNR